MIMEDILKHLTEDLKLPLQEEQSGSYSFLIDGKLTVQIEPAKKEEEILMGSFFAALGPGAFRERVLTAALQANYLLNEPSFFAFSEKQQKLLLFQFMELPKLTGQKLQDALSSFSEKAISWLEAIESGYPAPRDFLQTLKTSD